MPPANKRKMSSQARQRARKTSRTNARLAGVEKGRSASLNDLPEELIVNIVDHLPEICDGYYSPDDDFNYTKLPMLVALSATSQQLHRLVIDRLYESYQSSRADPYLFLRTLVTSPNLGRHVLSGSFRYIPSRKRYTPSAQNKKTVNQGLKMVLNSPVWKTWANRCNSWGSNADTRFTRSGNWASREYNDRAMHDVLYTAIMLHTPNLVQINAEHNGIRWTEALAMATWNPMRSTCSFDCLAHIHVKGRMGLRQLAPLLHTKSLRRLSLSSVYDVGGEPLSDLEGVISPACSNIEELELFDCIFDIPTLGILSNSIRALKRLQFQLMSSMLENDTGLQFLATLERHKSSLESLELEVFTDEPAGEEPGSALFMNDGLRDFVALNYLRCPLSSLKDMDANPDPPTDPSMDLSSNIKEGLPTSLKILHIDIRHHAPEEAHLSAIEHFTDNPLASLEAFKLSVPSNFSYNRLRLSKGLWATGIILWIDECDDPWSNDSEAELMEMGAYLQVVENQEPEG